MLNHRVDIPTEKMREHYTYVPFDSSELGYELTCWMRENIKREWNWDSEKVWPDELYYLVFRFEKEEDAMVFKLRWL